MLLALSLLKLLNVLSLNVFDSLLSLLELLTVEDTLLVREVLVLEALSDDDSVFVVHVETRSIRVVVGPFVAVATTANESTFARF